jgi:hypothetical protein
VSTYLVGFDLDSPGQDYRGISKRLQELSAWWHNLDSTWLVKTEMTSVQLRDDLSKLLDANDKLLIIDVTGRPAAWSGFSDRASAWIKQWM